LLFFLTFTENLSLELAQADGGGDSNALDTSTNEAEWLWRAAPPDQAA